MRLFIPLALVAALALPSVASAQPIKSNVVKAKTAKKQKGCKTNACEARVVRKQKKAVVKPYRAWLARVRSCESGGNYSTNTGNGFYGAYQFMIGTWYSVGGKGLPHQASPLEQDYRAVLLLKRSGSSPWPVCG